MHQQALRRAFLFYVLATLLVALQFLLYTTSSSVVEAMDFEGWGFFIVSAVSHASQLCLPPLLLAMPFMAGGPRLRATGHIIMCTLLSALAIVVFLNMQVYALYRFHINGFVLSMVFGESAGDIFTFSPWLYAKELLLFALIIAIVVGLWAAARAIERRRKKAYLWPIVAALIACTLTAHVWHIFASFYRHQGVVKSATLLPYYFPTTAYRQLVAFGLKAPAGAIDGIDTTHGSDVQYPLHPLHGNAPDSLRNIVVIMLDSWNSRAIDSQTTPHIWQFASTATRYTNHLSSSNGTRSSVFGVFFSLPCYYWDSFLATGISPVLFDQLQAHGYDIQTYPSASLVSPPIGRAVFGKVKGINMDTEGPTVYACDSLLTDHFIATLDKRKASKRPFLAWLFYDLPHSFELTKEHNRRFQPAWDFADYTRLGNDCDPTPFWNLYRNCVWNDDRMIGRVLRALEEKQMLDNTVVIITGDHSQEFNENHRGYWGHNGNFSKAQTQVPLIVRFPGDRPAVRHHRTTHYDIVPTLLTRVLGTTNPTEDYSAGHLLDDTQHRYWHFTGSALNYAFIIEGDTILEKTAKGELDVYTPDMKPVGNFKIDPVKYSKAIQRLNKYYK